MQDIDFKKHAKLAPRASRGVRALFLFDFLAI
jgi:hypothetical protein